MKKILYEEAKKKFEDQGRTDLCLIEQEYISWKLPALFFDKVYNDYFKAIPKNVYTQKSCHPKRAIENRKQTNLDRYGNACSLHGTEIKNKVKQTMVLKYGAEHAWHSPELREKYEQTVRERYGVANVSQAESVKIKKRKTTIINYGVEYPAQNEKINLKQKASMATLYGVEYPSQSSIFQEKIKTTLENRYGVQSPFQLIGVPEKSQQTCIDKYGKPYYAQSKSKIIVDSPTQQSVIEWWKSLPDPKPSYSHIWNQLKHIKDVTQQNLLELLERFALHKTTL